MPRPHVTRKANLLAQRPLDLIPVIVCLFFKTSISFEKPPISLFIEHRKWLIVVGMFAEHTHNPRLVWVMKGSVFSPAVGWRWPVLGPDHLSSVLLSFHILQRSPCISMSCTLQHSILLPRGHVVYTWPTLTWTFRSASYHSNKNALGFETFPTFENQNRNMLAFLPVEGERRHRSKAAANRVCTEHLPTAAAGEPAPKMLGGAVFRSFCGFGL